jgi:hypothetical protein
MKKNLAASVYERLKNLSKERKRPVQEIFKYYSIERFLYRLSISSYRDSFFLKGGLMLMLWNPTNYRATMDIDFLAKKIFNTAENLKRIIIEICSYEIEDGVIFETDLLKISKSQLNTKYQGISISFWGKLFTARIRMKLDFGFSDIILPSPAKIKYPVLLNFPPPILKGYTPQTLIAEKFEAIVRLGFANTRMKDFYDIWTLINRFDLNYKNLEKIIKRVMKNRGTVIKNMPKIFSESFYSNQQKIEKWNAFLRGISHKQISFKEIILNLKEFFKGLISDK